MRRAGVGGGEDAGSEAVKVVVEDSGIGLMADRSASREEEDNRGSTRVRPARLMAWSLCLSQHLLQMRLLMETSTCVYSCRVKVLGEESG